MIYRYTITNILLIIVFSLLLGASNGQRDNRSIYKFPIFLWPTHKIESGSTLPHKSIVHGGGIPLP